VFRFLPSLIAVGKSFRFFPFSRVGPLVSMDRPNSLSLARSQDLPPAPATGFVGENRHATKGGSVGHRAPMRTTGLTSYD